MTNPSASPGERRLEFVEPDSVLDLSGSFGDWLTEQFESAKLAPREQELLRSCFAPLLKHPIDSSPQISMLTTRLESAWHHEALSELREDANLSVVIGSVFAFLRYMDHLAAGPAGNKLGTVSLTSDTREALWANWSELVRRSALDWRRLLAPCPEGWGSLEDIASKLIEIDFDVSQFINWEAELGPPSDRVDAAYVTGRITFWLMTAFNSNQGKPAAAKVWQWIGNGFREWAAAKNWARLNALVRAVELAIMYRGGVQFSSEWEPYAPGLRPLFEQLDQLRPEIQGDRDLLFQWFRISVRLFSKQYGAGGGELAADVRRRLFESAREQLGRWRKELREEARVPDFKYYEAAVEVLWAFALKPWDAIKPLLLVFHALREAGVAGDLRYWNEPGKQKVPQPWDRIPVLISNLLRATQLADELQRQPDLRDLRADFAGFCLGHLKPREHKGGENPSSSQLRNEDLLEPNPVWRIGYIRAAQELRVNPRGRSHLLAKWAAENDPDAEVRRHAKSLYDSLRGHPKLERGVPQRRALLR